MAGRRPEWLRPRWPEPDGDELVDARTGEDRDLVAYMIELDAIADERDQLEADEAERRICSEFDIEEDP